MATVTEIARDSRNGGCPAGHTVDGDLKLATGEIVHDGMILLQGYELDDPEVRAQVRLDQGEDVLAAPESLILKLADEIRARQR